MSERQMDDDQEYGNKYFDKSQQKERQNLNQHLHVSAEQAYYDNKSTTKVSEFTDMLPRQ